MDRVKGFCKKNDILTAHEAFRRTDLIYVEQIPEYAFYKTLTVKEKFDEVLDEVIGDLSLTMKLSEDEIGKSYTFIIFENE